MKNEVKYGVAAVVLLAVDYVVPVVDLGITNTSIANAAGLCGKASSMGFGGMSSGGPCDWTPAAHYGALGIAVVLLGLAGRSFLTAKKAQ